MPWYLLTTVNMMFMGILFGFLPVFLNLGGFDSLQSGIVMAAVAIAFLIIQPVSGLISKRFGFTATIYTGIITEALFLIVLPFTSGWATIVVAMADAAGVGIVWTLSSVAVARAASDGEMGLAMGSLGSYKELGDMAGPLSIGVIAQFLSLTAGFVFCGLLGLAMLIPLIARPRKTVNAPEIRIKTGR